jgi:tetratricopeptide (TPR) repeat protein
MRSRLVKVFLAAAGGLLLFSCAPSGKPGLHPDTTQAQHILAMGDYQGALDSYAALADRYPDDKSVLKEYAGAVEQMKAGADASLREKDFAAAEKTYALLLENFPRFSGFEGSLSFGPGSLKPLVLECQVHLSERRARQALAEGDYLKALDGYKALPQDSLRDPDQAVGLRRIMEETKGLADQALNRKDFAAAGKAYAVLWNGYPLAQDAGLRLSFSRAEAEEGLKKCRAQLTREGLDQYRKGKLKEAVAIWQGLLLFDPENAEIRKAVDTATEQLKKLKQK